MATMRLFASRPRLTARQRESLASACTEASVDPHVLAVAHGTTVARPSATPGMLSEGVRQVSVAALRTHLAYGDDDGWTMVAWHEIDRGGWNPETRRLEVDQRGTVTDGIVRPGGRRHRIHMDHPARVAEVMSERVTATILFSRQVQLPDSNAMFTVVARRNLVDPTVSWLAVPGRGVKVDDEDVRAFATASMRRLQREFA